MNFYKHHIGDYAAATSHLSILEDGCYSRLLRIYYRDEKPLPADLKSVQRLAGARTRDEREAVQTVLEEFFDIQPDGWHSKRCDEEIARANAQADTNRRIAEEREARKKARNEHGSSNESLNDSCTVTGNESFPVREPSQTPDSRLQKDQKKKATPSAAPTALPDPPDWVQAEAWTGFVDMRRRERHPLTARAAKLVFSELGRLRDAGHDPAAVLDQSTRNGWRDVFAIREARRNGQAASVTAMDYAE